MSQIVNNGSRIIIVPACWFSTCRFESGHLPPAHSKKERMKERKKAAHQVSRKDVRATELFDLVKIPGRDVVAGYD